MDPYDSSEESVDVFPKGWAIQVMETNFQLQLQLIVEGHWSVGKLIHAIVAKMGKHFDQQMIS